MPCNFGIFQDKKYKFGNPGGILMQVFQKVKFIASMTSVLRHNRYFSMSCNFAIFEGRRSEFGKLGYFDMFIKVSVFHKYYFIC